MKSTKQKIEEFVVAICKPLGVVPTREEWARMYNMMGGNQPFAIIVDKKRRYLELRPYPGHDRAHLYACTLNGQLRLGNTVLYSEHGLRPSLRVCSLASWAADYKAIVPSYARPRTAQVSTYQKLPKRKERVDTTPVPRDRYEAATYYKEPSPENPYRRRCPNHGFQRTDHANRVMNWMGIVGMRP